jgi:hypothetical protein
MGWWYSPLLSRNTIVTTVRSKYLGENTWRSLPYVLSLRLSGACIYSFHLNDYHDFWMKQHLQCGRLCGYCIIVFLCPFLSRCSAIFRQPIPRLIGRGKQTSFIRVVSNTQYHSCRLLLLWQSEHHHWRPTMRPVERGVECHSSVWNSIVSDVFQRAS